MLTEQTKNLINEYFALGQRVTEAIEADTNGAMSFCTTDYPHYHFAVEAEMKDKSTDECAAFVADALGAELEVKCIHAGNRHYRVIIDGVPNGVTLIDCDGTEESKEDVNND